MNKEMRNIKTEYGTMSTSDGMKYVGEIVDGKPHGFGTYTSIPHIYPSIHPTEPKSYTFEGEYKKGLPNGFGTLTYPDEETYEGEFIKGKRKTLETGLDDFVYGGIDCFCEYSHSQCLLLFP